MTRPDQVSLPAGPRSLAGRPGETPIPFAAFATPATHAEPIDVVEDVVHDPLLSSTVPPPVQAGPGSPHHGVALAAGLPEQARAGRTLLALGETAASDGDAEILATRICRALAPALPEATAGLLSAHAAPDDLAHWAAVDAARAGLVAELDLVVCDHVVRTPDYRHLFVVDVPKATAEVLSARLSARGLAPTALLGDGGWHAGADDPHLDPALRAATVAQAHGLAGRALVFPGQARLMTDLAVDDVLSGTAVAAVAGPSGPVATTALLRCHGYARAHYRDGTLSLPVTDDTSSPWVTAIEVRYSRPCCGEAH